jgi:hypothetical protein
MTLGSEIVPTAQERAVFDVHDPFMLQIPKMHRGRRHVKNLTSVRCTEACIEGFVHDYDTL